MTPDGQPDQPPRRHTGEGYRHRQTIVGYHGADVNIALTQVVALVRSEANAYVAAH